MQDKFPEKLRNIFCAKRHQKNLDIYFKSFFLSILSRTFTIHRTVGEVGGYFINSTVTLPAASTGA